MGTLRRAARTLVPACLRRAGRRAIEPFLVGHRSAFGNVYHCCIQRGGSQWLSWLLRDPAVYRASGLRAHVVNVNHLSPEHSAELRRPFPARRIVTPFYVRYPRFRELAKPARHRTFFVMRDPRDILVSSYFSLRNSHTLSSDYVRRMRPRLTRMSKEEGISLLIDEALPRSLEVLDGWLEAEGDEHVLLVRYEDLVGDRGRVTFRRLLDHCDIRLSERGLEGLLERHSFKAKTGGRERGEEDVGSTFRKGVAGDWVNHLTEGQREAVRAVAGDTIRKLGYPPDPGP